MSKVLFMGCKPLDRHVFVLLDQREKNILFKKGNSTTIDHYSWKVHVLYWAGGLVLWAIFGGLLVSGFSEAFVNKLCYLPSQMIVTYSFVYLILPGFANSKYLRSAFIFVLVCYVTTVIARILKIYIYESILGSTSEKESIIEILTQASPLMVQYMIWVFLTPVITVMILLIIHHFREKNKIEQLRKEKNIAELRFLKAQVHPHFLFNTLNNLYTLAIQKSNKTADVSRKLREILDYMFYRCNEHRVLLKEEIQLINNYIDLEKLRYSERLQLSFNYNNENDEQQIAPLMFLTIVENAFKHGSSVDIGAPVIDIKLSIKNDVLTFLVYNSKIEKKGKDAANYRSGIGLRNLRRQLELQYGSQATLKIQESSNSYFAEIKLPLGELQEKIVI